MPKLEWFPLPNGEEATHHPYRITITPGLYGRHLVWEIVWLEPDQPLIVAHGSEDTMVDAKDRAELVLDALTKELE